MGGGAPGPSSSAEGEARRRFLTEASERLLSTSPTVSAQLGAEVIRLDNDMVDDFHVKTCTACGIRLIPGWSCRKITKSLTKEDKNRKPNYAVASTPRFYECDKCGSRTQMTLRKPVNERQNSSSLAPDRNNVQKPQVSDTLPSHNVKVPDSAPSSHPEVVREPRQEDPAASTTETAALTPAVPASSAASKKRARARKQGGLQALLAQRKTETASSQGVAGSLDLMDFMKSV